MYALIEERATPTFFSLLFSACFFLSQESLGDREASDWLDWLARIPQIFLSPPPYLFKNQLLFHMIHPNPNLPCLHVSQSPPLLSLIHCSSVFLHKRAGIPGILTEDNIARYDKTRHEPSYQDCTRQPSRRKRITRQIWGIQIQVLTYAKQVLYLVSQL